METGVRSLVPIFQRELRRCWCDLVRNFDHTTYKSQRAPFAPTVIDLPQRGRDPRGPRSPPPSQSYRLTCRLWFPTQAQRGQRPAASTLLDLEVAVEFQMFDVAAVDVYGDKRVFNYNSDYREFNNDCTNFVSRL